MSTPAYSEQLDGWALPTGTAGWRDLVRALIDLEAWRSGEEREFLEAMDAWPLTEPKYPERHLQRILSIRARARAERGRRITR